MKKLLCVILSMILVTMSFASCKNSRESQAKSVSEDYTVYSVLDEIAYDTENAIDAVQLKDMLYILEPDGVHKLDLATAETEHIFEAEGIMYIASGDGVIYLADDGKTIYTIDESGNLLNTQQIPQGTFDGVYFNKFVNFIATDDYYVFAYTHDKARPHTYIRKDDMSVRTNLSGGFYKISNYEGNKYFTYFDADSSLDTYILSYDIDSGERGERIYIGDMVVDFCYDKQSGNIKYYHGESFGMGLSEYDSDSGERTLLSVFTKEIDDYEWNCEALTNFNNLFVVVSDNLARIEIYDTEKEYSVINAAFVGYAPIEMNFLTAKIKDKYNIDVIVKEYDYDQRDELALKIMAGDSDIDIFYSANIDIADYVRNTAFTDLGTFESLKDNISKCSNLLEYGYSYNGKIFGIPYDINSLYAVNTMDKDTSGFDRGYFWATSAYLAKYFDTIEGTYSDDGTVLYELLKYSYEHPDCDVPCEEVCKDTYIIASTCYMMNPAAENKENAALLLNEIMNLCLGEYDSELETTPFNYLLCHYDINFDYSVCYPFWRGARNETRSAVNSAVAAAKEAKNYDEVKSISEDCYKKIRMTMFE